MQQMCVTIFVILCAIVSANTLPASKKPPTLATYEKLRKTPNDLRLVATVSILNGALQAEKRMVFQVDKMAKELYSAAPSSSKEENLRKIGEIEKFMARDRRAIAMLSTALDLATTNSSVADYRKTLQATLRNLEPYPLPANELFNGNVSQQMKALKSQIELHKLMIHRTLEEKSKQTMKYLKAQKPEVFTKPEKVKEEKKSTEKPIPTMASTTPVLPLVTVRPYAGTFVSYVPLSNPPVFFTLNGLSDFTQSPADFIAPYVERSRRQDDKTSEENSNAIDNTGSKDTTDDSNSELTLSEEDSDEDKPGGLVGLIASLSGGDEGSDVGALLGALTGVVTNLFGPGGLDIPSLLSSGTSLLAGLLGGDDNFGKVLAGYVVTAVDGFSGGGAADPEDEEGPPKPGLFVENFFKGLKEGKRRAGDNPEEDNNSDSSGSAGIFSFISNFVSSIVAGITSFILNASLGSSGGSSQGVADLSGSSSSASSSSSRR
ncbi:hypothetical protein DMENIID0001_038370 [Sergentomyia squamirostris]